jgi:hypothetical protein
MPWPHATFSKMQVGNKTNQIKEERDIEKGCWIVTWDTDICSARHESNHRICYVDQSLKGEGVKNGERRVLPPIEAIFADGRDWIRIHSRFCQCSGPKTEEPTLEV